MRRRSACFGQSRQAIRPASDGVAGHFSRLRAECQRPAARVAKYEYLFLGVLDQRPSNKEFTLLGIHRGYYNSERV